MGGAAARGGAAPRASRRLSRDPADGSIDARVRPRAASLVGLGGGGDRRGRRDGGRCCGPHRSSLSEGSDLSGGGATKATSGRSRRYRSAASRRSQGWAASSRSIAPRCGSSSASGRSPRGMTDARAAGAVDDCSSRAAATRRQASSMGDADLTEPGHRLGAGHMALG